MPYYVDADDEKIIQIIEYETPERLKMGEAYMICQDCGARLYSFDGYKDTSRKCPTPDECFN